MSKKSAAKKKSTTASKAKVKSTTAVRAKKGSVAKISASKKKSLPKIAATKKKVTTKKAANKKVLAKKKPSKRNTGGKKAYCSTAKVRQASKQQQNNIWGNVFDSDFSDDIKMQSDNFLKSFNSLFCTSMNCSSSNANLSQKLLTKISDNTNKLMEHNMQLGKDSLNCQNISDLIELHKASFETNYDDAIGFYSNIMQLVHNYVSENWQNAADCMDKNIKNCGLKN